MVQARALVQSELKTVMAAAPSLENFAQVGVVCVCVSVGVSGCVSVGMWDK
jgi:hypothetical protein